MMEFHLQIAPRIKNFLDEIKREGLRQVIVLNLVLALIYFLLARLGLTLATLNDSASPVWPATGFAFSIIYLFGPRAFAAVFLGAFVANSLTGGVGFTTLAISCGNTLEALAGAWIIHRVFSYRKKLEYHTETFAFVVASVFASILSASVGVASLFLAGALTKELVPAVWVTWWIGDVLGGLVVSPLLIQLHQHGIRNKKMLQSLGVFVTTLLVTYFVFFNSWGGSYLFLVFPLLLYAVRNLDRATVLLLSAFVCAISIAATVNGFGPFAIGTLNEKLIHLQLFLAAYSISSLTLVGFGKEKLSQIPTFVLLLCWSLSGIIFHSFDHSERQRTQAHLTDLVEDSQEKTHALMASYEEVLRGGVGLFSATTQVNAEIWKSFQKTLAITKFHPGMNGVGVVWPYRDNEIPVLQKEMRLQGLKNFKIKSVPGSTPIAPVSLTPHYVIKYIEPLEGNQAAVGLDVASDEFRRAAAEMARDTGEGAISSKVVLVQDEQKTPGFLYFLPIYKKNVELNSVDDRRKAHLGWIYAPIIYQNFFKEVFLQTSDEIELQVSEGPQVFSNQQIVFNNFTKEFGDDHFEIEKKMKIGQKDFVFRWAKSKRFISSHNTIVAWVGFCGALASLLLTNLMIAMQLLGARSREIAEDLTKELSDSREKFQQGERRLLYALDGSNDGIWDWNIEKAEMYVSGKIAETHGWPQIFRARSAEDLKQFAHPEDLKNINESIRKVLRGISESHEVETRYRTVTGEWRWVLTRGKISERDATGMPKRMTGVHIDIHELKRTQSLLEETQYQLINIANSVPAKVSLWNKDLKCEFANDLFGDWIGTSGANLVGKFMNEILAPFEHADRTVIIEKALQGEHLRYENQVVRPSDQEARYVITTYLPNKNKGTLDGFFLFIQDITDLKKAELLANAERKVAIEAANVKTQFLANMSHEIRTPLNGIVGMTNLLKTTNLNSKQREYSDIIGRSSDVLLNLINDILDFSKVEAGKLDLELVDFNLKDLITDVLKALHFSAEEKDIRLESQIDLGSHDHFKGDPGRIRQVLTNLVGNAIKFTPRGSVRVRLTAEESFGASLLKFEVIDTGIGIPAGARSRMFKAFSQADATMTRRFGGTGLGLSICKQLVHLMGGEIGVESDEASGSNFWFHLNLAHGVNSKMADRPRLVEPSVGARILIVEDNRVNQQIAIEVLQNLGYATHAVGNGIEALEALRESKYDLILMDCQMPEMDGFEATKIIRQSESINRKSIPIIAMTANAMNGDKEKCFAAGMNDYVSKPMNENELLRAIEACLSRVSPTSHILVVEDNKVNQSVIALNLEDLGYTHTMAENGREALQFLSENTCDLILMDCQMPVMDGFEATRRIRQLPDQAKAQIRIVALTANAMKGDREKCLASGMNDYLTKPIDAETLSETLIRWIHAKDDHQKISVIDSDAIEKIRQLQRPGQPSLLRNIIHLFFNSSEKEMNQIRQAIKKKDMKALFDAAHSLKASAASLGASTLTSFCERLEGVGRSEISPEDLPELTSEIEKHYAEVVAALQGIHLVA